MSQLFSQVELTVFPLPTTALALVGGPAGEFLALDGFKAGTISWQTFRQVPFAFTVTPELLASAILWAVVIRLLGGLSLTIRAARLPVAVALRET